MLERVSRDKRGGERERERRVCVSVCEGEREGEQGRDRGDGREAGSELVQRSDGERERKSWLARERVSKQANLD